ncbi:MAG: hypothetical protein HYU29_04600 [Chloroflexi bacterium]|nr:hypothetical protein [Chloroflexota bacterium]
MEGRYPAGILLILADLKGQDEARLLEWLYASHLPAALAAGPISAALFYRNAGRTAELPARDTPIKYLFVYEVARRPLRRGLSEAEDFFRSNLGSKGAPALLPRHVVPYQKEGPAFTTELTGRPVRGLDAVFTNCSDPAREEEFDRWYNLLHANEVLDSRMFHTAYRFHNVRRDQQPSRHLALYETDLNVVDALDRHLNSPSRAQRFYVNTLARVMRGAFVSLRP